MFGPFHFRAANPSSRKGCGSGPAGRNLCRPAAYAPPAAQRKPPQTPMESSLNVSLCTVNHFICAAYSPPSPTTTTPTPPLLGPGPPVTLIRSKWLLAGTETPNGGPRDWKIRANAVVEKKKKPALLSCSRCGSSRTQTGNQLL